MNLRRVAYVIEAVLCGGPLTAFAIYGFPWFIFGAVQMFAQSPLASGQLLLWLVGCICALGAFWHLAVSTVTSRRYPFKFTFWLGLVGAAFGLAEAARWSQSLVALLFFFAPLGCAAHFIYLQRREVSPQ